MAPARPIPDLDCDETYRSAAGKTLWTRFEEMMACRSAALAGVDPEGVHDMRVASRRLRAAIEVYADVFPQKRLRPLLQEVKQIADSLGEVRDLDVMIESLQAGLAARPSSERRVLRDLIAEMDKQRADARRRLDRTLTDLDQGDFARRFLTFVARETG